MADAPCERVLSTNRKLFTGHDYDTATGLYYVKARYYDPITGRFLTEDTYRGEPSAPLSLHRYNYAHGNPQTYEDEDGHSATLIGAALGFGWGLGQAAGAMIDDYRSGGEIDFGNAAALVAQNTYGGALVGASLDSRLVPGVSGGLGAMGIEAMTWDRKAATAKEFVAGQGEAFVTGAATDLAMRAGLGVVGAAGKVGVALAKSVGGALAKTAAVKVAGAAMREGAQAVAGVATQSARRLAAAARPAGEALMRRTSSAARTVVERGRAVAKQARGRLTREARNGANSIEHRLPAAGNPEASAGGEAVHARGGVSRLEQLRAKYGRIGDLDARINMRGNRETAARFMREQGIVDDAAADFFNGIDFSQSVSIGKLGRGQRLYGYQMPGRQGRWYSPRVASSPTELGISPWGKLDGSLGTKIHTQYRVTEPTMVLRSRAARVVDSWSAEPFQTTGTAPQLFAPAGRNGIENLGALK